MRQLFALVFGGPVPSLDALFIPEVRYNRGSLQVLNQLKLPHDTEYVEVLGAEEAFKAIKTMMVRTGQELLG